MIKKAYWIDHSYISTCSKHAKIFLLKRHIEFIPETHNYYNFEATTHFTDGN